MVTLPLDISERREIAATILGQFLQHSQWVKTMMNYGWELWRENHGFPSSSVGRALEA